MSNKEWKEGFEAGIDFSLSFVNDMFAHTERKAKFEGLNELVEEFGRMESVIKTLERQLASKEQS